MNRAPLGVLALALELTCSVRAQADVHAPLPGSDGAYGRFDGTWTASVAAGAEREASATRARFELRAHYVWSAGMYVRYADAFAEPERRAARALSLGADVRPLFLPRFALNLEQGPALLDLMLDSISLNIGPYFAQRAGQSFGDELGLDLGLGFGLPLSARASGLWLEARAQRRFPDENSAEWLFSASLSLHRVLGAVAQRASRTR